MNGDGGGSIIRRHFLSAELPRIFIHNTKYVIIIIMDKERFEQRESLSDDVFPAVPAAHDLKKRTRRLLGAGPLKGWAEVRDEILTLPQALDGLNVRRVEDFLRERGCPHTPYVILEPHQREHVSAILARHSPELAARNANSALIGYFSPDLQCVVLYRNRLLEAQNDATSTERLLVHELAHSSAARGIVSDERSGTAVRYGYFDGNLGFFLDEGYASLLEQLYVIPYRLQATTAKVASAHGSTADDFDAGVLEIENAAGKGYVFGAAMELDEKGNKLRNPASVAGSTMVLLCMQYPEFENLLLRARTDVRALRELKRWFDQFGPDTYARIRDAKYTESEEDFVKTQQMLLKRVGITFERKA